MTQNPNCPDCHTEMEAGFVPDFSYYTSSHSVLHTWWHPGDTQDRRFLGLPTGTVKIDKSAAIKIVAYRCATCGLIREYARG